MGMKFLTGALLATSFLAATNGADQSLDVISKLRGFHPKDFVQGHELEIASRRLDASAQATAKATQVGESVRKGIKQLRGGNDKFYQDLITAVKIYLCEQNSANQDRYVSSSSDNAYKDDNGNCILLPISSLSSDETVNAYSQGMCEVKPNCYWAPIEPGDTDRAKVYAYDGSPMDKAGSTAFIKKYATTVIGFVVPGIILSVLSLLTMIFFFICRCCCNRCGGRYPREEGYTCMQKFLPLLFFLAFTVGIVGVSAAAFVYRGTMIAAVDDMFNATEGTLANVSGWMVSIRDPLVEVRDTVLTSADLVQQQLQGTDFIEYGVNGLVDRLHTFGNYSANRMLPDGCTVDTNPVTNPNHDNVDSDGMACVPCQACTAISTNVGAAADQIQTNAEPGVEKLGTVRSQLNDQLVGISQTVRDAVDTQVGTVNNLVSMVDGLNGNVTKYDSTFTSYRDKLGIAVMALFLLALLVVVIGFVGILFGLTPLKPLANIIHIAYFLGFIVLFLTFIISAIFIAIGVVLGDVCEVTTIFSQNWTVAVGESKGEIVDACFNDSSLIDTLNLSSKLEFARGGVQFPALNLTSMLDFSQLDNFSTTIMNTNDSTFPFDDTKYAQALTTVNSYTKQSSGTCNPQDTYTVPNILQPWVDVGAQQASSSQTPVQFIISRYTNYDVACPATSTGSNGQAFRCSHHTNPCLFSVFMGETYGLLASMASVKGSIHSFVEQLHQNVTVVTNFTDVFKSNITELNIDINTIKDNLQSNLIKYVGEFEDAMHCHFLVYGYDSIYEALCSKLMPSLTMIALMLFLAGLFLIPINICLIIGLKRLKAHGNGHIMDAEMKFK